MRERARAAGLCSRCCKNAPKAQRSICDSCLVSTQYRVLRMRERRKEDRRQTLVAHNHEKRGDSYRRRLNHDLAVSHWKFALNRSTLKVDEARLAIKIATTLRYCAHPERATSWFERALELYHTIDATNALTTHALANLQRQCWFESRTSAGFEYLDRITSIIKQAPSDQLTSGYPCPHLLRANILNRLGHYAEAAHEMSSSVKPTEETGDWIIYLRQIGILHACAGRARSALADFELSTESSSRFSRGRAVAEAWDDYAIWAMELGRLNLARDCSERSLVISREHRIIWHIPYSMLCLVSLLVKSGEYQRARSFLNDAMTYELETPLLCLLKTTAALELAYALGDDELLQRSFDEDALELAMRSEEARRIGAIVAIFVKIAVTRNQIQRARNLVSRGMTAIRDANHVGELLALAAQYGTHQEAGRARELLCARVRLPHHRVAQAYLDLWETYSAITRGAEHEARAFAEKAAAEFARLGWRQPEREALALVGRVTRGDIQRPESSQRSALMRISKQHALTEREAQIAEFALQGLTNRRIARVLSISEHTVESHMTSILDRLGLRSRWQLTQFYSKIP